MCDNTCKCKRKSCEYSPFNVLYWEEQPERGTFLEVSGIRKGWGNLSEVIIQKQQQQQVYSVLPFCTGVTD